MESLADFGRASGLLYDDVPRDGGPTRTLPTREGVLAGAIGALLLLIGLAALGLLAATLANTEKLNAKPTRDTCSIERSPDGSLDDRCAPCEQQNEQQKLNEFVRAQINIQNQYFGTYGYASSGTLTDVGAPWGQDPLFPETFDTIQAKIYDIAQHIDMDLLDPYDAISFNETYLRNGYYKYAQNTSTEVEVCERRLEDWRIANAGIFPALYMYGSLDETAPVTPTSFGAWILDETLFNYYVDQLEGAISPIRQRIDGDWWTAVYNRIQANGGVLRAAWVNDHLSRVFVDMIWTDPLGAPQLVKLYISQRGYMMSPANEARLDDVLARYFAAQSDFFDYSLAVTPALVDPISANNWFLQYGWTDCFGYTNGLWYYNMDVDDLEAYYQYAKGRAEFLANQLLAQRDALWPADAWLPWQDTYLHYVFPEGYPNPLNISGWGFDPVQCDTDPATGAPVFGNAVSHAAHRYYDQCYQLYNAANGQTGPALVTLIYGGCDPLAGNAYTTFLGAPRNENWLTPSVFLAFGPVNTLNLTYDVLIHEMKHAAQSSMIAAAACPTCYSVFQSLRNPSNGFISLATIYAAPGNEWLTYAEGSAVDTEQQSILLGMQNEWESFHALMFEQQTRWIRTAATLGIRLGHWNLAGAMTWIGQYSWFPSSFSSSSIFQQSIRDMTAAPGWYGLGAWKVHVARERAQEQCGSGYNEQAFNTLTHALPMSTITAWDRLLEQYIANNCTSPTTRFGDARRTVVAPSLRGM